MDWCVFKSVTLLEYNWFLNDVIETYGYILFLASLEICLISSHY